MSWIGNYIPTRTPEVSPLATPQYAVVGTPAPLAVTLRPPRANSPWGLMGGGLVIAVLLRWLLKKERHE